MKLVANVGLGTVLLILFAGLNCTHAQVDSLDYRLAEPCFSIGDTAAPDRLSTLSYKRNLITNRKYKKGEDGVYSYYFYCSSVYKCHRLFIIEDGQVEIISMLDLNSIFKRLTTYFDKYVDSFDYEQQINCFQRVGKVFVNNRIEAHMGH
jgi:hypothetical protein